MKVKCFEYECIDCGHRWGSPTEISEPIQSCPCCGRRTVSYGKFLEKYSQRKGWKIIKQLSVALPQKGD
jgi:predicted  nucleic acid-binding Zn-ribbon protein